MTSLRLSLAALTLAVWSAALPAHTAVFAQFSPDLGASDFKWVRSGSGGNLFSIASNGATSAQGVATHFTFLDPALSALAFLPATFTLNASAASGNPAVNNGGGIYTQLGVGGSFSFVYSGVSGIVGGHVLIQNITNLLSGVFTNAWMQGAGASGSANLSSTSGSASYTSDLEPFTGASNEEFSFNLLDVTPGFGATPTLALNSFRANGGGNFSFLSTPEPAAWGLMLIGFTGLGLSLRARRRTATA